MKGRNPLIAGLANHIDESLGARTNGASFPAPVTVGNRDSSRRPLASAGRIPVTDVLPDPSQPRTEFADESLANLAQSIRDHGQINPIQVRWSAADGKWQIVSGERRWRACKLAGVTTIACIFMEEDISEERTRELQLIENCLREDLSPLEEAKAFAALMKHRGWTGKQLAEKIHVSPSRISRSLALLRLPPEMQTQVESGTLSPRTGYELGKIVDKARGPKYPPIPMGRVTHKQAQEAVRRFHSTGKSASRGTKVTFVNERRWSVSVTAASKGSYDDVERALLDALEEVRHWIEHGRQLY